MKRFHVNVSVEDINEGIRFYSALFAGPPTVQKSDYAKWMLEDPRINFAIAQRGQVPGVNHVGFQVDSPEELTAMRDQLTAADNSIIEQADASCCYAKSNKYWVTDPAGVAWETFHTLDSIPIYGEDTDRHRQPDPDKPTVPARLSCVPARHRRTRSAGPRD